MLAVQNLFGFGSHNNAIQVSNVASDEDETDLTTYSWAGVSFGAADSSRYLLLGAVTWRAAGAATTISSATIGGISATELIQNNDDQDQAIAFYLAHVPTGTSGTVAFTASTANTRGGYGLWRIVGALNPTPFATAKDIGDPCQQSIAVSSRGIVVGFADANSNPSWGWTNLNEDFDDDATSGSMSISGASALFQQQQSVTVTADPNAAVDGAMVLVSFRPFW